MSTVVRPLPGDHGELAEKSWAYLGSKRCLDVLVAAIVLCLLLPLFALIALAIKLYDPGPVFFHQTRVGKHGRPFTVLKFRSMRHNCSDRIHQEHMAALIAGAALGPKRGSSAKLARDPRITGLGRILRRTSIDELPQIINVLRGEMSLVGPRPVLPYEVELYKDWYHERFRVVPGITGLWQVRGRNQTCFDDAMRMDVEYARTASFWLDLKILAMTPYAVIRGKGAG